MGACIGHSGGISHRLENNKPVYLMLIILFSILTRIAYTPYGAILPQCGATLQNVTEDIKLLSQLTPRIHLYAADWYVSPISPSMLPYRPLW